MAEGARAGAPPQEAALMTDRALEWLSYRRSGKIGDLPGELIGPASEPPFVDDAATLGPAPCTPPNARQIAPPVLSGLPRNARVAGAPCGARTPNPSTGARCGG